MSKRREVAEAAKPLEEVAEAEKPLEEVAEAAT